MHVDLGEDFRIFSRALGFQERLATFHGLARLFQNADHVEIAATANTEQEHFHRPNAQVTTTSLGRTVHDHDVTAAGFTEEHGFASPLDACLHRPDSTVKKGSPA
ncbi:hypothetical protein D3C84_499250 [compost metagenome]